MMHEEMIFMSTKHVENFIFRSDIQSNLFAQSPVSVKTCVKRPCFSIITVAYTI
jgi:hypothetical protein